MKLGKEVEKEHIEDLKTRESLKKHLSKLKGKVNTKEEKKAEDKTLETIVKPHLKEIPNYYDLLIPMEKRAKKK